MHTHNLYETVLIDPSKTCDQLVAVSGYVSGAMVRSHLRPPTQAPYPGLPDNVRFDLVYGMYSTAGVDPGDHRVLQEVMGIRTGFSVHYNLGKPPIHAKVYVWLKSGVPKVAFAGSANYSVNGFFGKTLEVIAEVNPDSAFNFSKRMLDQSKSISSIVNLSFRSKVIQQITTGDESTIVNERLSAFESVELPLYIVKKNTIHLRSGLNWGQRPGREPNQAYIPVPANIASSGFFPPRQTFFTLLTDDGQVLECVIAQDNDKAIETPANNSLLGVYFRNRLSVSLDQFVQLNDLDNYGRRTVKVYRITEDKYFMDFRISP